MPRVIIRDCEFSYREYGVGFPIVFSHSFLWDAHMWQPQVEYLSQHYRCLVPELWGHGDSGTRPEADISLEDLADDHWQFLQALEIDSCVFVGLSVGGMIGPRLAASHPQTIKGLIVMDSYVGPEKPERQNEYLPLMDAIDQTEFFAPEIVEMIAPYFFSPHTYNNNPDIITAFKRSLSNIPFSRVPTVTAVGRGIFNRRSFLEELKTLQVPTLYMVGEDDMPRPVSETQEMAALTPGASYVTIPQAGHIPSLEQPELVNQHLESFLKSVLSGSQSPARFVA